MEGGRLPGPSEASEKPKVLCVDDEPQVIAGLSLHLRRRYQTLPASSGAAGIDLLRHNPSTAVIISDMRMPGMDGATFLELARQIAPEASRILLTGQADLDSAIAAVNHGHVFRFLTKPCPPSTLMSAVDAAADMHRLVTAERVLLEQTLRGCLNAVTNVLALTSPLAFGCATRVRTLVSDLQTELGWAQRWEIDIAAMLCQLGSVSLPPATAERVYYGKPLSESEAQMVRRIPALNHELLGSIPRIEVVLAILSGCAQVRAIRDPGLTTDAGPDSPSDIAARGAALLKVAIEFDALETRGLTPARAVAEMRSCQNQYDPVVLEALHAIRAGESYAPELRDVALSALSIGMVLADDVRTVDGLMLAARGFEITGGFVERIRNYRELIPIQHVRVFAWRGDARREAS